MPIFDPLNTASQSHHSLAQLDSADGLLPAAGDPIATSGGPAATVAPALVQALNDPKSWSTAQATASGDTAVWTPAAGMRFRLQRLAVYLTADAALASPGTLTITMGDGADALPLAFDVYVPDTALTAAPGDSFASGWIDLGSTGLLSALADNVLNVNLSAALASGACRVIAGGTEA